MSEVNAVSEAPELTAIRAFLGKQLRIRLDDERVIQGEFQCMDKDLNFIIGGATEYHGMSNMACDEEETRGVASRYLGMAAVPGKHITAILLHQDE
jgi:small nuclear ribonucleoprotein (snRNP)-like protein